MVKLFKEKAWKRRYNSDQSFKFFSCIKLSLIAARDTLGLNAIMVNSVGASTYGGILKILHILIWKIIFSKEWFKIGAEDFLWEDKRYWKEFEDEIKEK